MGKQVWAPQLYHSRQWCIHDTTTATYTGWVYLISSPNTWQKHFAVRDCYFQLLSLFSRHTLFLYTHIRSTKPQTCPATLKCEDFSQNDNQLWGFETNCVCTTGVVRNVSAVTSWVIFTGTLLLNWNRCSCSFWSDAKWCWRILGRDAGVLMPSKWSLLSFAFWGMN